MSSAEQHDRFVFVVIGVRIPNYFVSSASTTVGRSL